MSTVALLAALLGVGVATGMLAGLLGVGGGVLMVPFLVLVVGMTQHAAEATSLLVVLPTAIVASLTLRKRGVGDLRVALAFGTIGAAGGVAGALLALTLPAEALRTVFAVFLALTGGKLLRDGLRRPRTS